MGSLYRIFYFAIRKKLYIERGLLINLVPYRIYKIFIKEIIVY